MQSIAKSMHIAALVGLALAASDDAESIDDAEIKNAHLELEGHSPAKRLLLGAQVKRAHKLKHDRK